MKVFWKSKTFWVNIIAAGVLTYNALTGENVNPHEVAIAVLPYINILLRFVTKEPITWNGEE